jgi:hypothetical protein
MPQYFKVNVSKLVIHRIYFRNFNWAISYAKLCTSLLLIILKLPYTLLFFSSKLVIDTGSRAVNFLIRLFVSLSEQR